MKILVMPGDGIVAAAADDDDAGIDVGCDNSFESRGADDSDAGDEDEDEDADEYVLVTMMIITTTRPRFSGHRE